MREEVSRDRTVCVDQVCPGDHAFMAFSDDDERWDILGVFAQQGFMRDEKVLLLVDAGHDPASVAARVCGGRATGRRAVQTGQLVVSSAPRFARGRFDAKRLVEGVRRRIDTSTADGFSGLRGASEMSLTLAPVDHLDQAVEYETALHDALFAGHPDRRHTALCYWDERLFGGTEAMEAVRAVHPVTVLPRAGALHVAVTADGVTITGDGDLANRAEFDAAPRTLGRSSLRSGAAVPTGGCFTCSAAGRCASCRSSPSACSPAGGPRTREAPPGFPRWGFSLRLLWLTLRSVPLTSRVVPGAWCLLSGAGAGLVGRPGDLLGCRADHGRDRGLAAQLGEPEDPGEEGQPAEAEGEQREDVRDLGDLPPAVSVQQHGPQRLALEDRGHGAGELGVAWLRLRLGGQLGVGLATSHVLDVHGDEAVCVGLSLLAGQQLLARVLRDRRDHARRDLGARLGVCERRRRRETDLLGGELALHRVVHVSRPPEQQTAGDQQDDTQRGTDPPESLVESSAAHLGHLPEFPPGLVSLASGISLRS